MSRLDISSNKFETLRAPWKEMVWFPRAWRRLKQISRKEADFEHAGVKNQDTQDTVCSASVIHFVEQAKQALFLCTVQLLLYCPLSLDCASK